MKNKILNIYISRFLSSFNLFLFVPFYPVWLHQEKLLSTMNISIVTALVVISLRSASLLFAAIIKKHPKRHVTTFCLLLTIIVYLAIFTLEKFHISYSILWYLLSLLLGSLIAITSLALLSAIALQVKESHHRSGFSYMNIALNLSAGIGTLIASYVMHYDNRLLPVVPILFSLVTIYFSMGIPMDIPVESAMVVKDKNQSTQWPFILFIIANVLTFFGYAQFYDVFPIFAKSFIDMRIIGALFLFSGVVIVLLQIPFTKIFEKFNHAVSSAIGNLVFGFGIFLLLFASQSMLYLFFLAIIILSIGEVIFVPTYYAMAIKLSNNPVMSLAITLTGRGIGESLGTFFGVYTAIHGVGAYSYVAGTLTILFAAFIIFFIFKKSNHNYNHSQSGGLT